MYKRNKAGIRIYHNNITYINFTSYTVNSICISIDDTPYNKNCYRMIDLNFFGISLKTKNTQCTTKIK